jgi:uncharacterized protein (DUF58 family)
MLREMEEPAGADITMLLDGTAGHVVGEVPDTNFELAVRAVGSVADYALRAGRGVSLICHERTRRQVRLTPDGGGRRVLLETLAETRADATAPLSQVLRRLLSDRLSPLRAQTLTVVGLTMDTQLASALLGLREEGVRLGFLCVPGISFAVPTAGGPLLPLPAAAGERERAGGRRRRAVSAARAARCAELAVRPASAPVPVVRRGAVPDPPARRRSGCDAVGVAEGRPGRLGW